MNERKEYMSQYKTVFYRKANGEEPVKDFLVQEIITAKKYRDDYLARKEKT